MRRNHFHDPAQALLPLEFRHLLACGSARPGDPRGHVYRKPGGILVLRVTVADPDPKLVGRRIKVSLRTRDSREAAERRDILLTALHKAGVLSARTFPEIYLAGDEAAGGGRCEGATPDGEDAVS